MATGSTSIDNLLDAVKQLSPDELAQFTAELADWQGSDGENKPAESYLVRQTKLCLPPIEARRLHGLVAKSEQGELTPTELQKYQELAIHAERISAARVQALAALANRRKQPIHQVKKDVGWQEEPHGA